MVKNFQPNANTYGPGGTPLAFSQVDPIQTLSADGAITLLSGLVVITKTSAAAITLAVPDQDGQRLTVVSQSTYAHTITTVSPGYNNNSSFTVITLSPIVGDSVVLESQNGVWWVVKNHYNGNIYNNIQVLNANGAVTIKNGLVMLTKASVGAFTIAAPTAGVDDGSELQIITTTAQAHVLTSGTDGFNAKGSSGTATWTAAIGNGVELIAYNGHWYAPNLLGVTIA